jgi:periplasmic protein TonB
MFEDSLMESGNRIKRKNKFWSFVAFLLNAAALLALVIWPLLHPEALPKQMMATLMVAPSPPPAPPPATPAARVQAKGQMLMSGFRAPSRIPETKPVNEAAMPQPMMGVRGMEDLSDGIPGGIGSLINDMGTRQPTVVRPKTPNSLKVSSGMMAGNLLAKTFPQYPAIARAARIQGTVVLQATISKSGMIENLRVISGPTMLQQAAMDAVRSWRYKPYLLNGEPVEVETTINVVFSLGE